MLRSYAFQFSSDHRALSVTDLLKLDAGSEERHVCVFIQNFILLLFSPLFLFRWAVDRWKRTRRLRWRRQYRWWYEQVQAKDWYYWYDHKVLSRRDGFFVVGYPRPCPFRFTTLTLLNMDDGMVFKPGCTCTRSLIYVVSNWFVVVKCWKCLTCTHAISFRCTCYHNYDAAVRVSSKDTGSRNCFYQPTNLFMRKPTVTALIHSKQSNKYYFSDEYCELKLKTHLVIINL